MNKEKVFSKILIANRSEIALRIIRSAKAMGIETVAIYSEADRLSAHMQEADEAYYVGGSEPSVSYLNIARIIEIAVQSGAQAVHPGYGFLAENPEFAEACVENNLIFIGPDARTIDAMGNKARAKIMMSQAGVVCIPGYEGENQDAELLSEEAKKIGYPVLLKAAAGGGGRGMRFVNHDSEFRDALRAAKSEALTAFGNDRVIIEKALQRPRHIEVQILADQYGNVIHLADRDCSVQRRHQKVIEEAPAPLLDDTVREALRAAAIQAAQTVGYQGAGTIEFLLDHDKNFYFMEMNTRLQVEHTVTEEVTGIDIVQQQIRVAAGECLEIAQEDVVVNGHSIEVRLCAEDMGQDFMPQSGPILFWRPDTHATTRVETGIRSGDVISPHYDSMFAKIIVHGRTREQAIQQLRQALRNTVVFGVQTNKEFILNCLEHQRFCEFEVTTGFLNDHRDVLMKERQHQFAEVAAVVAALTCYRPEQRIFLERLLPARVMLQLQDKSYRANVKWDSAGRFDIGIDSATYSITVLGKEGNSFLLDRNGKVEKVFFLVDGSECYLHIAGETYTLQDHTYQSLSTDEDGSSEGDIVALSSCRVVDILVAKGDRVERNQTVLVTETMKMEYQHLSTFAGVVEEIFVSQGDHKLEGEMLAKIVPALVTPEEE